MHRPVDGIVEDWGSPEAAGDVAPYERLSTLDASFLALEDGDAHMHVGSIGILDATPFRLPDGALDFPRIERAMMQILPRHPRLRRKVWRPTGAPPVWVDDPRFDPTYHFRRAKLPSPGTEQDLKTLVGALLSSQLDRDKPLWETCIVEGLADNRFAIVWKLHHCVADGIGVREILFGYLGFSPSAEVPALAAFTPQPEPSLGRLHLDAARRRFEKVRQASARIAQSFEAGALRATVADTAASLLQMGADALSPLAPTPFNGKIGPYRRTDWTTCEFSTLQDIRKASGAKINDVALAVVCAAIRQFLLDRGIAVDDLPFRVMVPVNMRSEAPQAAEGNYVASLMIPLSLVETDPRRRLQAIIAATTRAKASGQSWMGDLLLQTVDWADLHVSPWVARLAARHVPANLVVTNLPGPQIPQYLLEAKLVSSYSAIPLARGQGLGVALYTYNGVMHWGFNADRELLPDLGRFVRSIDSAIQQLHEAHLPVRLPGSSPARVQRNHGSAAADRSRPSLEVERSGS